MPYTHEHGSYYLREGSTIRLMCDQVAVAFAEKDLQVLKHGSPESVQKWWQKRRLAAEPLFGPITIATFPRGFPVEEINRIVERRRLDAPSLVELETAEV